MNKKLMAVAVAGALAAPALALAQASNVQIYGRVNAGLDNYSATGATAGSNSDLKSRYRIFDQGSKIGFRGSEDLGGGLRATFLMESGVNVDNGGTTGQGGQANSFTGTFASRYGNVGLEGNFGRLTFGKSDVYWGNGLNDRVTSTYAEAGVSWTTMGRGMSTGISRQNNVMQYTSPTFSGFNAIVSYSPNAQEAVQSFQTQGAAAGSANTNTDGKLWGLTLNMNFGQFMGGVDYVKVQGNSLPSTNIAGAVNAACLTTAAGITGAAGANCTTPENTGTKLRMGWAYQPGAQISFIYNKNSAKNWSAAVAGAGGTAQGGLFTAGDGTITQDVYGFSWEHTFGNIQVMAQWNKYRDAKGCQGSIGGTNLCANTNATGQTLAARYLLSKRTDVYVNWSTYRNASAYNNDYTYAGVSSNNSGAAGLAVGADPRFLAFGLSHWF